MEIKNWLDADRGRYKAMAAHLGVSLSRVSQIATDGVPAKFMLSVRNFTNGAVTLEEMVSKRTPIASEMAELKNSKLAPPIKPELARRSKAKAEVSHG